MIKLKFYLIFFIIFIENVYATNTGIGPVDQRTSVIPTLVQALGVFVGLGCITVAAIKFGSLKGQGAEGKSIVIGLFAMGLTFIGGTAYWISQTSGFNF